MKLLSILAIILFLFACTPDVEVAQPQKFVLEIRGVDTVSVEQDGDGVSRMMDVNNPEGKLSFLTFVLKGVAYMKIFSGLSVSDVTRAWSDLCILEHKYGVMNVNLFINSPGGDAFSGLALADQIERAKKRGMTITAHASGIIASAAVPVFAVCSVRLAAPGTIFMVHEAAIWKWPGRETASDIRSQNDLMELLGDRYISKLVANSNLDKAQWQNLEYKTTWFSAKKAKEYGLVDKIE
jgi:ATP-dependent protease ClpP protease subunit